MCPAFVVGPQCICHACPLGVADLLTVKLGLCQSMLSLFLSEKETLKFALHWVLWNYVGIGKGCSSTVILGKRIRLSSSIWAVRLNRKITRLLYHKIVWKSKYSLGTLSSNASRIKSKEAPFQDVRHHIIRVMNDLTFHLKYTTLLHTYLHRTIREIVYWSERGPKPF